MQYTYTSCMMLALIKAYPWDFLAGPLHQGLQMAHPKRRGPAKSMRYKEEPTIYMLSHDTHKKKPIMNTLSHCSADMEAGTAWKHTSAAAMPTVYSITTCMQCTAHTAFSACLQTVSCSTQQMMGTGMSKSCSTQ
eukprot:933159-Pelagomonas_calceolata.AAC.5